MVAAPRIAGSQNLAAKGPLDRRRAARPCGFLAFESLARLFHIARFSSAGYYERMAQNHWLVKQEPGSYSWDTFVQENGTAWTGIRNFQARNHLRAMKVGDLVLFYHSGARREVVGLAEVTEEAYPDPTATEGDWSAVDLAPIKPLAAPVSLQTIKADQALSQMPFVKQSRLSVASLSAAQFKHILKLSETKR